ncbi:hypothetical protein [Ureibacillus thermophilus]|uniref:Uncharacterized protein n=1 Tax=Ureibacillus thermophilus TaxID=367743 RepID=A0A4P6UTI7_9BACL|nr:hypothetical protein [Ureibacillus thermophilus]QBK26659.1 hypothetical protein DKZ56_12855 [Ureibacillus thermophilus]
MDKVWSYGWKILWVIGLFILLIISFDLKQQIEESINYRIEGYFWYIFFIRFLLGIYLSFICIKQWKIHFNYPMLIGAFLPCLIISLVLPVSSITTGAVPFGNWIAKVHSTGLTEIAAGVTLMLGIFHGTKKEKNWL